MANGSAASSLLAHEARALLMRLSRLQPFAVQMPMVMAASISMPAQTAIESHMIRTRHKLRAMVRKYLSWLQGPEGRAAAPVDLQRRFTFLRLRFNSVISQFDIFADVLSQRSEHHVGVWVAGLDVVARDALQFPGAHLSAPPVICYLDRGHGAAIRRARTRLPGGEANPVAIIRVPRERMVGSGIASSLIHEVGHQGAALLDLVNSLRPVLQQAQRAASAETVAWRLWERWISEIVADFWSVSRVGIASTTGLLAVVSLPRIFVFRAEPEDPHPMPWIRVKLSCAMGQALYPHPQWSRLGRMWESFYPLEGLDAPSRRVIDMLETTMPRFVELLVGHRPAALRGKSLKDVFSMKEIRPERLAGYHRAWGTGGTSSVAIRTAPPTLVFAVIGQARADGKISPEEESGLLEKLLSYWAVRGNLDSSAAYSRLSSGAPPPSAVQLQRPIGLVAN